MFRDVAAGSGGEDPGNGEPAAEGVWIGKGGGDVRGTRWKTSLFPDKSAASSSLPIKAAVRAREQIQAGTTVEVLLVIEAG